MTTTDAWQALGDPTRRRVMAHVAAGAGSVTEIADALPVSRPAVSQHLRVLLDARLVESRRVGRRSVYRVRPEALDTMRRELDGFWRRSLDSLKTLAEESFPADDENEGS